jgi:formylmethanofuran dehydrogenase subunit E-like metal-binding protein
MAVKDIEKKKEPTIILKEIKIADVETIKGQDKNGIKTENNLTLSKLYGTKFPIISIGGKI